MTKLIKSFAHAIDGFLIAFREERNMRLHSLAAIAVVVAGLSVGITHTEWAMIAMCIAAVFAAELFNTSIEAICDVVSPGQNERIKVIKDLSAAAVFCTSIGALIVAVLIFVR